MTVSQLHDHNETCKPIIAIMIDQTKAKRKTEAALRIPRDEKYIRDYDYGDTQEEDRIEVLKKTKDYQLRALLNPEEYRIMTGTCYTKKKADTRSGETKVQHPPPKHEESKQRFETSKKNAVQVEQKGISRLNSIERVQKSGFPSTTKLNFDNKKFIMTEKKDIRYKKAEWTDLSISKNKMEKDRTPNVKNFGINDSKIFQKKLKWEKRKQSQRLFKADAEMNEQEDMEY